jgi:hypothetical protein
MFDLIFDSHLHLHIHIRFDNVTKKNRNPNSTDLRTHFSLIHSCTKNYFLFFIIVLYLEVYLKSPLTNNQISDRKFLKILLHISFNDIINFCLFSLFLLHIIRTLISNKHIYYNSKIKQFRAHKLKKKVKYVHRHK